jgi:hypothetical protein
MADAGRRKRTRAALMAIGIFELIFGIVVLFAVVTCARCAQDNAYLSTLFFGPLLILFGVLAASVAALIRRDTPIAPPFGITTGAGVAAVLLPFLAVTTRIVAPPITDAVLIVGALAGAIVLARVIQAQQTD